MFLITLVLVGISFLGKGPKDGNKYSGVGGALTAFECGFNSFSKEYVGFCVQFLNIAILFLLVDLEIALIVPFFFNSINLEKGNFFFYFIQRISFFLLLLLYVE